MHFLHGQQNPVTLQGMTHGRDYPIMGFKGIWPCRVSRFYPVIFPTIPFGILFPRLTPPSAGMYAWP
jgi:hypothetical protein